MKLRTEAKQSSLNFWKSAHPGSGKHVGRWDISVKMSKICNLSLYCIFFIICSFYSIFSLPHKEVNSTRARALFYSLIISPVSRTGFLTLSTTDFWAGWFFAMEVCPVHCTPGLQPRDASDISIPPRVITIKNISRNCQLNPRGQHCLQLRTTGLE